MNIITKLIQKIVKNVFIAVVVEKNEYIIRYIIVKNSKIIKKDEKRFLMEENRKFSSDILKFLSSFSQRYKFIYISYFLDSFSQNCLPTCNENEFRIFNVNIEKIAYKCIDNSWIAYVLKSDIKWVMEIFEDIGIDFIFSPFVILNNFIKNMRDKRTFHILYTENSITMMIFDANKLLFSSFFRIPYKEPEVEDDSEELKKDDSEDLKNIINDEKLNDIEAEEDSFSEFIDITDIGEEEESDSENFLENAKEEIISSKLEDLELYGKEIIVFKYISLAIEEYYKSKREECEFIENVIIYSDSKVSDDIINMIENELFLNVVSNKVDVKEEMIRMSREEVGL